MTVTVQTTTGPREVEALAVGGYFAVHRTLVAEGSEPNRYTAWTITHLATGHKVTTFQFKKSAVACAREIGALADWTQVTPHHSAKTVFSAPVYRALIAAIQKYS